MPLANLGDGLGTAMSSAVYAIHQPDPLAPSFPWGSSNEIFLIGWYDGVVRVHDLRDSARTHAESSFATPTSTPLPLLALRDCANLSSPIYGSATGGGHGAHVVARTALRGVISICDVRSPPTGSTGKARPGRNVCPPTQSARLLIVCWWKGPAYGVRGDGSFCLRLFPRSAAS